MADKMSVCIVGLGLMGGSLALALRHTQAAAEQGGAAGDATWGRARTASWVAGRIVGVSRSTETLAAAQAAGAIDAGTGDLVEGVRGADIVVLATPVRTILRLLPEIGRAAGPGALILDLGSTKTAICAAMAGLPAGLQPVGGHPMCGKEVAGFAAAEAGLFRGRRFVLCPLPRTAPEAFERAVGLAEAVGAKVVVLDPQVHDRAVAAISHLPYTAAVALVNTVAAGTDDVAWALAASGFRDTTRVASSDVDMMLDILLTNREAVLAWLDAYTGRLAALRGALAGADESALSEILAAAQQRRLRLTF